MKWSRKVLATISGLGLVSFIVGINLLDIDNYLAGFICAFLGGFVFFVGLILTIISNTIRRHSEQNVKYGRYDDKT